jgi:hypothetical protein
MPEYVLTRGQPRTTADKSRTIYETERLRKECADAAAAIQWAREVALDAVPAGNTQAVVPAAVWLIEACGRAVIWEMCRSKGGH